jgi:hypothetical protein
VCLSLRLDVLSPFFLSFPKGYADMEHAGQPTMYKAIEKGIQCDGDIALY